MGTLNDLQNKAKKVIGLNKIEQCANSLITKCSNLPEERRLAEYIKDQAGDLNQLKEWVSNWSLSEKPSERRLACHLVAEPYKVCKHVVLNILLKLSNDSDWTVREEAAWAFSRILERDFYKVCDIYKSWSSTESDKVRRAIVVAAMRVGKRRQVEFAGGLFELIDPLMDDRSKYVRKSLGAYALGDGLLRYYPERGFQFLWKCMKSNDEQVRWNIAMSLSSTAGARYVNHALEILSKLALDKRRYVWRAVASAMRELARRKPLVILPVLKDWLENQQRQHVAKVVAQYVDVVDFSRIRGSDPSD